MKKDYRVHNLDIWMGILPKLKITDLCHPPIWRTAGKFAGSGRKFGLEFDISYNFHVQERTGWEEIYGKDGAPVMRYADHWHSSCGMEQPGKSGLGLSEAFPQRSGYRRKYL